MYGCTDRFCPIGKNTQLYRRWHDCAQCRHKRANLFDCFDNVGTGLTAHFEQNSRLIIGPGRHLIVLDTVDHLRHIAQSNRTAIFIIDDQCAVLIRIVELIIGADCVGLGRAIEHAFGSIDIGLH